MKRTWKCPKCQSARVGYFESLIDAQGTYQPASRKVGEARREVEGILGGRSETKVAAGELEAFVCTDCGYMEEYVKDPQSLDWNAFERFRWCNPPG